MCTIYTMRLCIFGIDIYIYIRKREKKSKKKDLVVLKLIRKSAGKKFKEESFPHISVEYFY